MKPTNILTLPTDSSTVTVSLRIPIWPTRRIEVKKEIAPGFGFLHMTEYDHVCYVVP